MKSITHPVAIVDETICRRNISRMAQRVRKAGLQFRPHFKTHQSLRIGEWFRDEGVSSIVVSSPGMARYFMMGGWNDITLGIPATSANLDEIQALASKIRLKIFLNDIETARYYDRQLTTPAEVWVELDAGYGRSGIDASQPDRIKEIIDVLEHSSNLSFYGFYLHEGRTYQCRDTDSLKSLLAPVQRVLKELHSRYPDRAICLGDTPAFSILDEYGPATEASPGNFVFYDLMQTAIGSCNIEDVALTVLAPLLQSTSREKRGVLYGGAVHLSKERIRWREKEVYGIPVSRSADSSEVLSTGNYLYSLSQEHGMFRAEPDWLEKQRPGDILRIWPVHSCLTANLYRHYYTSEGHQIEKRILS
ncbi:MAG: alanine racemase [Balneolaceae bacterium]